MRAAGRVLAALVVASASVLLPAAPAAAAEDCVGVVVDARLLGGDVRTGCAEGDPTSGLQALTRAGFSYAFLPRQPGLVCQVDRAPDCSRTSTTTYWSYWYRAKGAGAWTYSAVGAGSRDPEPGSTEAWVWQDGGRREPPDIAFAALCPQARSDSPATGRATSAPDRSRSSARKTDPAPSSRAETRRPSDGADRPARTKRKDDANKASGTPAPGTPTRTPETSAAASAEPAPATPSSTPTPSDGPSTTAAAAGRPASDGSGADDGGPGPLGLVVGLALVASLATAAVLRARRPGGSP